MRIESLRVQNYKVLRDVRLENVSPFAVLLGANGSGKSTLLDVFAFLRDCVRDDVDRAVAARGGVDGLFSRGASGNLTIELTLRLAPESRSLVYQVEFKRVEDVAFVARETLTARPYEGRPREDLLSFEDTQGSAAIDEPDIPASDAYAREGHAFVRVNTLALNVLGQIGRYKTVALLRDAIDRWACTPTMRLDRRPSLLPGFVSARVRESAALTQSAERLYRDHPESFRQVVSSLRRSVPGLTDVEPREAEDRGVVLEFSDQAFDLPFGLSAVSEGTRRLLSIYLRLQEPDLPPLLTYEEPENDLYPQIVRPLAEEFRAYAERGSQVFVSTHSPDFVNGLELDELYWMEKRDGFARVVRAKDDPNLVAQHVEGELLGSLWREGMFGRVDPL